MIGLIGSAVRFKYINENDDLEECLVHVRCGVLGVTSPCWYRKGHGAQGRGALAHRCCGTAGKTAPAVWPRDCALRPHARRLTFAVTLLRASAAGMFYVASF